MDVPEKTRTAEKGIKEPKQLTQRTVAASCYVQLLRAREQ